MMIADVGSKVKIRTFLHVCNEKMLEIILDSVK